MKESAQPIYETASEWKFIPGTLQELSAVEVEPADFHRVLGADKRTVSRWAEGKSLGRLRNLERIRALSEILELAKRAHGSRYREWFLTPNPHISHMRPTTLLGDKSGLDLIKNLLYGSLMGGVA